MSPIYQKFHLKKLSEYLACGMSKIKVIDLLKSLPADEIRLLDKFVRSPVHNRHESVIKLFKYLRKALARNPNSINLEKIFVHLFPSEPFNAQKVHHVSSYLLKVVEEFLSWNEWRKNEVDFNISLLESYRRLKQPQLFYQTMLKSRKLHAKGTVKDSYSFEQVFRLESVLFSQMRTDPKNKNFRLQELSDTQDTAFIISKLRTACILLSNQAVTKTSYDLGLIPAVQKFVEDSPHLENPTVAFYYFASKALSNYHDDESFGELKKLLIANQKIFDTSELYDIHIFAINYCIRRLNSGDKGFMREVFDIYQSGLATGVFLEKGKLAPRTYSNIVMSGLRLGEYDIVESFIHDYKDKLPQKQREGFFNYNLAHLFYEKKKYDKAMPLLLQIETHDVLHNCTARTLLAKMYYELGETESLASLIQSFKIFLKRKHLLGYHRELYLNFTTIIYKLNQIREPPQLDVLLTSIEQTKILAEKQWLIEQIQKKKAKSKRNVV